MIGEDKMIRFSGCPNSRASSIVIRGANSHVLDEAQRSLHDALCVLSQARPYPYPYTYTYAYAYAYPCPYAYPYPYPYTNTYAYPCPCPCP